MKHKKEHHKDHKVMHKHHHEMAKHHEKEAKHHEKMKRHHEKSMHSSKHHDEKEDKALIHKMVKKSSMK